MKLKAKERVFQQLQNLNQQLGKVTSEYLAEVMDLSRQNVNHYLVQLEREKRVQKINGHPNYWYAIKNINTPINSKLHEIIGANGSLKSIIQKCTAAIKYPPQGLNILLTGNSGVGKSFLAHQLYEYSKQQQVISAAAPFVVLNCADYADNPELLSATLFGYKQGAFTGANKDVDGLIANANGGYLFLDEVHRLSQENQEKLFVFLDTGRYRPIGEYKNWKTSKVRFIFATTEKVNKYFLNTFRRRIPVIVHLSDFSQRPVSERLDIVEALFKQEAKRLKRTITIDYHIINTLIFSNYAGNIGDIKNLIKISCAQAYNNSKGENLFIDVTNFPQSIIKKEVLNTLTVTPETNEKQLLPQELNYQQQLQNLFKKIINHSNMQHVKNELQQYLVKLNNDYSQKLTFLENNILQLWEKIVVKRYGLLSSISICKICLVVNRYDFNIEITQLQTTMNIIKEQYPRSTYVVKQFIELVPFWTSNTTLIFQIIASLLLSDCVNEKLPAKGLLLAHGENTASSIQAVVNQLCGNYIYEAIDMPMDSNVKEIIIETRKFLDEQVNADNLVLIVDMGSLQQIYSQLKDSIKGQLLVVNNLTTAVALDLGLKLSTQNNFSDILKQTESKYEISIKYFEGFARKNNIIISCMSGLGISEQLQRIFKNYLSKSNIEIYTKGYSELKQLIESNNIDYFKKTQLIITTSNLPESFSIPHFNIYDVFDDDPQNILKNTLLQVIDRMTYDDLVQDLIKFFSLKGIAARLRFLNPEVVTDEVETIIAKYENYFHQHFPDKVKLNLYMHLALMLERLIINRDSNDYSADNLSNSEKNFYQISKDIFQPLEQKYHIHMSNYEISLLYELMQNI
ncbi:transcription antiterminator BglG [Bombilactobacillus bombi]|uniref:DNA translocase FtsK n=1 Tax=Bombilactobacillus bombi TaxID=1303590 RepID=A0A417ZHI5_9LACO|nr:sigma 54-interacting transcriptional regulator [Bombilactobacillus bombi]RHW51181.1 transcription antiterminator BglG [Bombilactobacillus bombi]